MSQGAAWLLLVGSGIVDVAWAIAAKKADGFARPLWTGVSLLLLAVFVIMLTRALAVLPLSVAYPVWVGVGALGTFFAGSVFFGEPLSPARMAFAVLVAIGVGGLRATAS